jgi:hypothetical protein
MGAAVERGELIAFLLGRIEAEFDLAAGARPSPARDACFHRIGAYCDVLVQVDPDAAEAVRVRMVEAH